MDGMGLHDDTGAFTYLNNAQVQLYGYDSPQELLGKSWEVLYDAPEVMRFKAEILPLLWETGRWRGETTGVRKDGSTFPQEVSLTTFGEGGLICVVRDISAQKLIERTLKDTSAAMHTFVSIASHELKNPLTVFQSYIELLTRRMAQLAPQVGASDDFKMLTRCAQAACARMRMCINTLLDTSRINEGRLTMELENADLCGIVTDQVEQLRQQSLPGPPCSITLDLPGPTLLYCDRVQVNHLVANLLSNAMKYGQGKPVEVTVRTEKGRVKLTVRDHGIGISSENQKRIFGRFERAVTSARFEGTGLGLWIVVQIARAHDGTVGVTSSPNEGTTFTVDFPQH